MCETGVQVLLGEWHTTDFDLNTIKTTQFHIKAYSQLQDAVHNATLKQHLFMSFVLVQTPTYETKRGASATKYLKKLCGQAFGQANGQRMDRQMDR
jgi:hypothetical protein